MYSAAGTNPAVRHFLENSLLNQDGVTPTFTPAQIAQITSTGRIGLLNSLWSPFTFGGNPLGRDFDVQENTTTQWRVSSSLGGDLPEFAGMQLEWEVAFTYHWTKDTRRTLDIPTYRLQNALNGFGGPDCTQNPMPGAGGIPGAAGCYYFNPFTSAYASNLYTGAVSPNFVGTGTYAGYVPGQGLQNNPEMVRWLYETVTLESDVHQLHRRSDRSRHDGYRVAGRPHSDRRWRPVSSAGRRGQHQRHHRSLDLSLPVPSGRVTDPELHGQRTDGHDGVLQVSHSARRPGQQPS